ncbi:MAG: RNA recognition motif-containing protein [Thelocarpon superellum]|nr:MAG: RNA recognition motif-containing protein [Thelocarpon superellum]
MAPARKKRRSSNSGEQEAVPASAQSEIQTEAASPPAPKELSTTRHDDGPQAPHLRKQLFIRSLPPTATNDSLTEYFSESYPIKHATVVVDSSTKQCKGFGFVTFADVEDARRAKQELNGTKFQGRKIKVEEAEPRHRELAGADQVAAHPNPVKHAAAEAKAQRQQQQAVARLPPKLIIRNLPWSIKEPEQLATLFRSYGKVKHATIPKKKPGLMSGFGFVVMRGRANAEKALQAVNGKEVDGRTLAVDWAVEKDAWQEREKENVAAVVEGGPDEEDDESFFEDVDGSDHAIEDVPSDDDRASGVDSFDEDDELERSPAPLHKPDDNQSTLFIRNLPFTATDETLLDHFRQFGAVRYARVVMDHATDRSKGSGFVCFYKTEDADACIRQAPRVTQSAATIATLKKPNASTTSVKHSVLENELADPSGQYSLEGRVLHVSRAVARDDAHRLAEEGVSHRNQRDRDKRRLYLLSEGTVASNSPLYHTLPPSEISMREGSAKQRKALLQNNPSLHLSLTRLSIRNVPRHITSKDLKALAREAVVGFAKDVKAGMRQQLSKEEESRGGGESKEAERARKVRGKGIVQQAKVVFEGREGGKVSEDSGAGRSRGYGFIEYSSHRWALMGLRWLNGHAIGTRVEDRSDASLSRDQVADRKRRLIVEFAIENAQVVARRKEREAKARDRSRTVEQSRASEGSANGTKKTPSKDRLMVKTRRGMKRKRGETHDAGESGARSAGRQHASSRDAAAKGQDEGGLDKVRTAADRRKIIAKKRMQRKSRKGQGP